MMFNPAHGEKGAVGDAIRALFSRLSGDFQFGDAFLVGQRLDENGDRVLAFRAKGTAGVWTTVATINRNGVFWPSSGGSVSWKWDILSGVGTVFMLTETPIANSIQVFRNGVLELGWTLSGKTLTLADEITTGDTDLRAHYQY